MKHRTLLQPLSNPTNSITVFRQSYASFSALSRPIHEPLKTNSKEKPVTLTQQELTKINLLIPRLCLSNHLTTAIHLTTTALLTNPPLKSLSFSILVHSLTSQPDMSKTTSLLTILKHNPHASSHLSLVITTLVTSYIRKNRPKEAFKVYNWSLRSGCDCKVEKAVFFVLVCGFCEYGMVLEALNVLREMLSVGFVISVKLRERLYRSLLRDARVVDALKLNEALCEPLNDKSVKNVVVLLDSMIENWKE